MPLLCGIVSLSQSLGQEDIDLLRRITESLRLKNGRSAFFTPEQRVVTVGAKHNPERQSTFDGNQPLTDERAGIFLFFDGFLANADDLHITLKNKGHDFLSSNGAEAIIHLYQEEGTESFAKLNGEFIFVLYDNLNKTLYLVRDKIGTRPLYYTSSSEKKDLFIFTNQMGALLESGATSREVNEEGLYHYFGYGAAPPPFTLIKGVSKIPAGNFIELKISEREHSSSHPKEIIPKVYWLPIADSTLTEGDENYAAERVKNLLTLGVTRRIKNEQSLIIPLGGMDSTALLALARKKDIQDIQTLTSSTSLSARDPMLEAELSSTREMKDLFRTRHHEMMMKEEDVLNLIPHAVKVSPEPCAYYALSEIYQLTQKIAELDKGTAIFGTLADALFLDSDSLYRLCKILQGPWGRLYSFRYTALLMYQVALFFESMKGHGLVPGFKTKVLQQSSIGHGPYLGHKTYLNYIQKRFIFSPRFSKRNGDLCTAGLVDRHVKKLLKKRSNITPVEKFVAVNLMLVNPETVITYLYNCLSPFSIETRFPYVDMDLMEFVLGIPLETRMKNGIPKYILKRALEGIVPNNVIHMKKVKLGRAGHNLWRKNLAEKLEGFLKTSPLLKEGDYFHLGSIKRLIQLHGSGKLNLELYLYPLLVFLYWHEIWIEGKDPESVIHF